MPACGEPEVAATLHHPIADTFLPLPFPLRCACEGVQSLEGGEVALGVVDKCLLDFGELSHDRHPLWNLNVGLRW